MKRITHRQTLCILLYMVAALCLIPIEGTGQTARFFTADNYLTNSLASCLMQDSRGFLWVGTRHGLTRYDGHRFRHFTHEPDDSLSLGENNVLCMAERPSDGRVAVGVTGRGADAYIEKPFNIDIIKQTVQNLLQARQLMHNKLVGMENMKSDVAIAEAKSSDDELMERVMRVVDKNLSSSELTVEFLACEVGLSRPQLHRRLKAITNQTVSDFIRNIRLKHAARMLENGHQSIAEVAYDSGFESPSAFSAAFKRFYGVAPSEFVEK